MTIKTKLIINKEMHLISHANGVKLVTPDELRHMLTSAKIPPTVESLLQLPFSFYFLNTDSATQLMNEEGAAVCGFDSVHDALGRTLFDVANESSAKMLIENCAEVMREKSTKIFEESHSRQDGVEFKFLSLKMPWYNQSNKIIGVIGCSIALGRHSLSESISILTSLGLLDQNKIQQPDVVASPQLKINQIHLSQRELQCLKLTLKGYTSKKIAQQLGISFRTVEEYLLNVRIKSGAGSKAELIGMMMDSFI